MNTQSAKDRVLKAAFKLHQTWESGPLENYVLAKMDFHAEMKRICAAARKKGKKK